MFENAPAPSKRFVVRKGEQQPRREDSRERRAARHMRKDKLASVRQREAMEAN